MLAARFNFRIRSGFFHTIKMNMPQIIQNLPRYNNPENKNLRYTAYYSTFWHQILKFVAHCASVNF